MKLPQPPPVIPIRGPPGKAAASPAAALHRRERPREDHPHPARSGRVRRGQPLRDPEEDLPAGGHRAVRELALGAGVRDADHLLRAAVAALERPAGRAARHRRPQVLHLRAGAVAAGRDLPDGAAGHLRLLAVPVHRGRRPAVVRLRLPADGLHRNLPVGRAQDRGRARGAHAPRPRAVSRSRSWSSRGPEAHGVARDRGVDRLHVRRLLHADHAISASARSPGTSGRGRPSGSCSTASRRTATRASCASRCASTCARTRGSSRRCSTATRSSSRTTPSAASRAARAAARRRKAAGLGHCVDCNICVQVCPTGIDIRKGLQYECIGCAACIDGCDQVMDRMGYPKGLIRYASENALAKHLGQRGDVAAHAAPADPDLHRTPARDHRRHRGVAVPAQSAQSGHHPRSRRACARSRPRRHRERLPAADHEHRRKAAPVHRDRHGLPGIKVTGSPQPVVVGAAARCSSRSSCRWRPRRPRTPTARRARAAGPGSRKIEIVVQAIDDPAIVRREASSFLFPR